MNDIKLKHYSVLKFRFKSSSDDILPVTVWKSLNFFKLKSRFNKIKHMVEYHEFSHESEIDYKALKLQALEFIKNKNLGV